jgi:hypothetical protein
MPYILDARSFDETDLLLLQHFGDFKATSLKVQPATVQPSQKLCTPRSTVKDAVYGDGLMLEHSSPAPTPVVAAPRFIANRSFCFNSDEVIELRDCEEVEVKYVPSKHARQTTTPTEESSQLRVNPIKEIVYGYLADALTEAATATPSEKKLIVSPEKTHFKKIIQPVLEVHQATSAVVPCVTAKSVKVSWKAQMFQGIDVF